MVLQLVKKDFLLAKKYALIMPLMAIILPLIMSSEKGMGLGFIVFLWTALAVQISLTGTVSVVETKYSKGAALLCAVPYTRSMYVKSKYLYDLFIFVCYCLIYSAAALVFPDSLIRPDWFSIGIVFLAITLIRGTLIPLEIKLGYQKTKYISMLFIFFIPFVLPTLMNALGLDISMFSFNLADKIPQLAVNIIPFILAFAAAGASLAISIGIYSKKDL